jgi:hypothetical protein
MDAMLTLAALTGLLRLWASGDALSGLLVP